MTIGQLITIQEFQFFGGVLQVSHEETRREGNREGVERQILIEYLKIKWLNTWHNSRPLLINRFVIIQILRTIECPEHISASLIGFMALHEPFVAEFLMD